MVDLIGRVEDVLIASGFKKGVVVSKGFFTALSTRDYIRSLVFLMQVVEDDYVDNDFCGVWHSAFKE